MGISWTDPSTTAEIDTTPQRAMLQLMSVRPASIIGLGEDAALGDTAFVRSIGVTRLTGEYGGTTWYALQNAPITHCGACDCEVASYWWNSARREARCRECVEVL